MGEPPPWAVSILSILFIHVKNLRAVELAASPGSAEIPVIERNTAGVIASALEETFP
jgi:hypothetical protein